MPEHGLREIRGSERRQELREVASNIIPVAAHSPQIGARMGGYDCGDGFRHPHPAVRPEEPVEQIDSDAVAYAAAMRRAKAGRGCGQDSALGSDEVVEHFRGRPRVGPWTERHEPRRPTSDVGQHLNSLGFEYSEGGHGIGDG